VDSDTLSSPVGDWARAGAAKSAAMTKLLAMVRVLMMVSFRLIRW
jgi:hypothetical protein